MLEDSKHVIVIIGRVINRYCKCSILVFKKEIAFKDTNECMIL